ncbi:hypothetical protein GOV12_06090 [Candidatus Pacearchaeota archaeon]|nr:hypothetical protein [Candidatus Pacearchaeota archaeon]
MNQKEITKLIEKNPDITDILENIKKTNYILENNLTPKVIGLISGTYENQIFLENRFKQTNLFKSSYIFSTLEEIRKQNFLGTLAFYQKLKKLNIDISDDVILCGMVFGKGERLYPITNALRNMKPSMLTAKSIEINNKILEETLIETAVKYFTLVSYYLKENKFYGILDKWGDEIQIPGIDLFKNNQDLSDVDLIKIVSEQIVNETTAKEKDWVSYDENNNLLRQIPRRPIKKFDKLFEQKLVKKNNENQYVCGVSLGPVAISYRLLETATIIFKEEIEKPGVYFDFDPYLIMALCLANEKNGRNLWELERDEKINKLDKMMIQNQFGKDFFDKILSLKNEFEKTHNKKLNLKILDFKEVYWADLGLHNKMREYFMSLKEKSRFGFITREISNIPHITDKNENRIINSNINKTKITNSVIINSNIKSGIIKDSVIINSNYNKADINNSFTIGDRAFSLKAESDSGSVKTISKDHIHIPEKHRHVSIPLTEGITHFKVSEDDDLRKINNLETPIRENPKSFRQLYQDVFLISQEDSEKSILELEKEILDKIESED